VVKEREMNSQHTEAKQDGVVGRDRDKTFYNKNIQQKKQVFSMSLKWKRNLT
jgi:hypothetical protein